MEKTEPSFWTCSSGGVRFKTGCQFRGNLFQCEKFF